MQTVSDKELAELVARLVKGYGKAEPEAKQGRAKRRRKRDA